MRSRRLRRGSVETSTPGTARSTSCTAWASRSREGEVVTLLGRNGAGKTTTLRSIMGMVQRRQGQVRFGTPS